MDKIYLLKEEHNGKCLKCGSDDSYFLRCGHCGTVRALDGQMGMYGETPKVFVGNFSISAQGSDRVWIENKDGEGGEFSIDLFEKVVDGFFKKHF